LAKAFVGHADSPPNVSKRLENPASRYGYLASLNSLGSRRKSVRVTWGIGGHLCVVVEDTDRFIGERRLRVLRETGAQIAKRLTAAHLFAAVAECLAANQRDLPFALIYLLESDGEHAALACRTGIHANHRAAPSPLTLETSEWPIKQALAESTAVMVDDPAPVLVICRPETGISRRDRRSSFRSLSRRRNNLPG
jgi:hypothetical protein